MPVVRVSSSCSPAGFSESISEILGDVSIFTAAGESVMIKDLWDQEEGVAVVALLRHFGCICCWELASTLKESKSRFDSAGVKLVAVGVGTPENARILAERLPFPMDSLYADPDRKAYDVLGLYYGFGRTFFNRASASVFSRFGALKKVWKNYTIKATPDNRSGIFQQGGIFVFKGKQLLYARKDKGTGDHAPLEEVLNICCTLDKRDGNFSYQNQIGLLTSTHPLAPSELQHLLLGKSMLALCNSLAQLTASSGPLLALLSPEMQSLILLAPT